MGVQERVTDVVVPILADLRCELYDLDAGGNIVRITVDRDGGVDLETLALITRLVSRELDATDPLPGAYTLEVTSPGLERTLRRPDHFRRAVGSVVAIRTQPGVEGDRRVEGTLRHAGDDGIVVHAGDAGERHLTYDQIERARTVFSWGGQPKPGQPKQQKPGQPPKAKKPAAPGAARAAKAPSAPSDTRSDR